jgi:hypothetical protein
MELEVTVRPHIPPQPRHVTGSRSLLHFSHITRAPRPGRVVPAGDLGLSSTAKAKGREVEAVLRNPAGRLVQPRPDAAREVVVVRLQGALWGSARGGNVEVESMSEEEG